MNKYESFVKYFDWLVTNCKSPVELSSEVKEVRDQLERQGLSIKEKPLFTEIGLQILEYLQQNASDKTISAKDIAVGMDTSSRKVSGAIRKLVDEGYINKSNFSSPVLYALTEKGHNFNIVEYKRMKNKEKENE